MRAGRAGRPISNPSSSQLGLKLNRLFRMVALRLMPALAALGVAGIAVAQTPPDAPQTISPLRVEPDHNAVNVISGKIQIEVPTLSAPGAGHLSFDRIQNAAPYVSGTVADQGPEPGYDRRSYSVHTGSGSESFQCEDFDCASVTGSGSIFYANVNRFIQAGSGATYHFAYQHYHTQAPHQSMLYYASSIDYPNGETITYTYDQATLPGDPIPGRVFWRPNTITSNLGFYIALTYQSSDINAAGWTQVAQAALYASGSPATLVRRMTYSADGGTITDFGSGDPNGRIYHCTGCTNTMGIDLEVAAGSSQLPGEGSNASQVTAVSGANVVGSVTRDGVGWTYSYDNLRASPIPFAYLYNHLTVNGPNGYHQVYDIAQVGGPTQLRNVITRVTDSIGRSTSYLFDEAYRPWQVTYPEGNQVTVSYDAYGNVNWRRSRAKPGSGLADIIETANFPVDTCGSSGQPVLCYRPTWSRDGLNRQTDYVYNAYSGFGPVIEGQLTERIDPPDANGVRRRISTIYEASTGISRPIAVRTCNDTGTTCGTNAPIQTIYDYTGRGSSLLPAAVNQYDPATGTSLITTYSYDASGRLIVEDGPIAGTGDAKYYRYDVYGRRTWEIGPADVNGVRMATYTDYRSADDKPNYVDTGTLTDPNGTTLSAPTHTAFTYDSRRYAVRAQVSAGGATQSVADKAYDDQGRLVCSAVRMNPAAFGSMPGACALTTTGSQGPDRITLNSYDAAGQMLREIHAYGITTANGFPATLQQNYASYTYSPNGKRLSVTDANGNMASMTYDGYDRQIRWNFPSTTTPGVVSSTDYEAYTYDTVGNRMSLRRRDGGTLTFSYDNLNRMLVKTVPTSASGAPGYSVHYGYDLRNAQLFARFGSTSGLGITNSYDGFGRLASSSTNMDGTARTISYTSDAHGNHTAISGNFGYYAGYTFDTANRPQTVLDASGTIVRMTYDSASRLTRVDSGTTISSSASVTYDAIGRPATLSHDLVSTSADQSFGYSYNPASQITTRTSSNDSYASNTAYAVDRSYTVNGLNQYTTAGTAVFGYDANGNLTSDGSRTFTYDAENRLVAASGGISLAYDPLGRLWQVATTSTTTRFIYDGDALIWETDGAGNRLRSYIHGSNASSDDPLVWYDSSVGFARRYLHTDQHGSIIAAADEAGNAAVLNAYDAWGIPNAANQGRFQYTGQAWLVELGMYYYKARIYSPTLGRFMQTDPVGYDGGINLYAYVSNDPVNQTDATGLATDEEIRQTRRTLNLMIGYTRREIAQADVPAEGSRIHRSSDNARVAGLRVQLRALEAMRPEVLADMRVDPSNTSAANNGLTNAMRGGPNEVIYAATRSNGSVTYGQLNTASTDDSGRAKPQTGMAVIGHNHGPGAGREYPGVGDPTNVLRFRVPMINALDGNSNAIGWNGSRFTLSNVQGALPSYASAPAWMKEVFAPW